MASGAIYSHDRRDETATPLCGAFRTEGNKNALLVKPQLGCVKSTVYDLPSAMNLQHEYGLRQERDGTSSAEVLGNWNTSAANPNIEPGRDFVKLNKGAATEGVKNCKEIADYRKTHDFRLKIGSEKKVERAPYDSSTAFGRPTNAATSFNDLVSHSYRYDWVAEAKPAEAFASERKKITPTMTKSAIGLAAAAQAKLAEKEPEALWKMKCFESVPPKIGHQG